VIGKVSAPTEVIEKAELSPTTTTTIKDNKGTFQETPKNIAGFKIGTTRVYDGKNSTPSYVYDRRNNYAIDDLPVEIDTSAHNLFDVGEKAEVIDSLYWRMSAKPQLKFRPFATPSITVWRWKGDRIFIAGISSGDIDRPISKGQFTAEHGFFEWTKLEAGQDGILADRKSGWSLHPGQLSNAFKRLVDTQ
jgi:hypothetical protein